MKCVSYVFRQEQGIAFLFIRNIYNVNSDGEKKRLWKSKTVK